MCGKLNQEPEFIPADVVGHVTQLPPTLNITVVEEQLGI